MRKLSIWSSALIAPKFNAAYLHLQVQPRVPESGSANVDVTHRHNFTSGSRKIFVLFRFFNLSFVQVIACK